MLKYLNKHTLYVDLDKDNRNQREIKNFMGKNGYDKGIHKDFKVGDKVTFNAGADNNIPVKSTIKGISENNIYVYANAYWFPVNASKIKVIK